MSAVSKSRPDACSINARIGASIAAFASGRFRAANPTLIRRKWRRNCCRVPLLEGAAEIEQSVATVCRMWERARDGSQ